MTTMLRFNALLIALALAVGMVPPRSAARSTAEPEMVRVMSFNLWHGGEAGKQPLEQTAAVIKAAGADIVGLQETGGLAPQGQERPDNAAKLAKMLGWQYVDQGSQTGIISRFKIVASTPKKWGAKLELASGRRVYLFNVHFAHAPYQPYQLLRIPYEDAPFLKTEEEAVQAARDARGGQVARLLAEVETILPEGLPVFITGDFNEPSHLDWMRAAAQSGVCPLKVDWPTTKAVMAAGFLDAYRHVHPDPVKHRGLTWTPTTPLTDPRDRHEPHRLRLRARARSPRAGRQGRRRIAAVRGRRRCPLSIRSSRGAGGGRGGERVRRAGVTATAAPVTAASLHPTL